MEGESFNMLPAASRAGEKPQEEKKAKMVKIYCGCGKYIGEKEVEGDSSEITHGFCEDHIPKMEEVEDSKEARVCQACGMDMDISKEKGENGICRKCCSYSEKISRS